MSEITKQSLSGASVTFSSIPSGVTRIVIAISDCSTDGTDDLGVQIGDSGGIETSGYDSKARDVAHDTDADNTDCFNFSIFNNISNFSQTIEITNIQYNS